MWNQNGLLAFCREAIKPIGQIIGNYFQIKCIENLHAHKYTLGNEEPLIFLAFLDTEAPYLSVILSILPKMKTDPWKEIMRHRSLMLHISISKGIIEMNIRTREIAGIL